MKATIIIASILCVVLSLSNAIIVIGQSRAIPNVDSFIEEAIFYRFAEDRGVKSGDVFFIKKDSLNTGIKTDYGSFKIRVETEPEIFRLIGKKLKGRGWYNETVVRWLGNDTCDIDVYGPSVYVKRGIPLLRKRQVFSFYSCRGTGGYSPTARFVYNANLNKWIMFNYKQILEIRRQEEKNEMDARRKKYYEEKDAK